MTRAARIESSSNEDTARVRHLEDGLSAYLSDRWQARTRVTEMSLVPGGAARQTWRCSIVSGNLARGAIVRVQSGNELLPSDERAEYLVMVAMHRAGYPVPEPIFFEKDERWLGRAFSIVAEVPDCSSSPDEILPTNRPALGRQFWGLLGDMTRHSPQELGVDECLLPTTTERCANEQLAYWWEIMNTSTIHPNPIAHAGFRWLSQSPPPPARKLCLVHGDYRTGNYLYSPTGEIRAILDWEMAHIGDPLEDLAWSLDLRQNADRPGLAGGLLPNRQAIRHWQDASGLEIDPGAFRWWQVFSAFKALSIWTLSAKKFQADDEKRPVLARIGWLLAERQQRILLDYISPLSGKSGYEFVP